MSGIEERKAEGPEPKQTDIPPAVRRRQWQEHIEQWRSSGLTQKEYCRRNGFRCSTFHYWRKHLETSDAAVTLVQVPIGFNGDRSASGYGLKLLLGDRYKIEIGDKFHPSTLARLVAFSRLSRTACNG